MSFAQHRVLGALGRGFPGHSPSSVRGAGSEVNPSGGQQGVYHHCGRIWQACEGAGATLGFLRRSLCSNTVGGRQNEFSAA